MTEPTTWSKFFGNAKKKIKTFLLKLRESYKYNNEVNSWENIEKKILERELKTKEAKKAWEEKKKQNSANGNPIAQSTNKSDTQLQMESNPEFVVTDEDLAMSKTNTEIQQSIKNEYSEQENLG